MKYHRSLLFIIPFILTFSSCRDQDSFQVSSPDGTLSVVLKADDAGQLNYTVLKMTGKGKISAVLPSPLGLTRDDQDFSAGLSVLSAGPAVTIDESYTLMHGKRRECRNHAWQRTYYLKNQYGKEMDLIVRAYDEGIAFRYHFPETDPSIHQMDQEHTGFRIPENALAFMQPHADAYPSYEQYYLTGLKAGTSSPNKAGWSFPALFHLDGEGLWVMLTEAGLDRNYCGTRLAQDAPGGMYRIRFPDEAEGNGEGEVNPSSSLPWSTPWRVIFVGESPGDIIESSLVTHLASPPSSEDTDWIKPGRASWSWWSDSPSTRDYGKLQSFIDLAAEMGWEYSLVDAGWPTLGKDKIKELVNYAEERSVGIMLWYHSGGHPRMQHNDMMKIKARRGEEFRWLQETGVAGIKADFFLSDKQLCINQYIDILEETMEHSLMVNFHGCTLPRGWERTYPNLMTMEAVRGAEMYKAHEDYPENAPVQNTIWPFTRNVMGPMDYTPTAFSDNRYPHLTSYTHELALPVIYESGWIHFIDAAESYLQLPAEVKGFLGSVPAAWDDIKFLSGYPGEYIILARKKGEEWYLGGINGEDTPMDVGIELSFLGSGEFNKLLFTDGESGRDISIVNGSADASRTLSVSMAGYGGFAARFSPR